MLSFWAARSSLADIDRHDIGKRTAVEVAMAGVGDVPVPERIELSLPRAPTSSDVARAVGCHLEHLCEEDEFVRVLVLSQGLFRANVGKRRVPTELLIHANRSLLRFDVECGAAPAEARSADAVRGLLGVAAAADRWGIMCHPKVRLWAEIDR
jgi:hypothetical protein